MNEFRAKYIEAVMTNGVLQEEIDRLGAINAELLAGLMEIAKGEGAFSLDQFTFANNTIENMKDIANATIAKAEGES